MDNNSAFEVWRTGVLARKLAVLTAAREWLVEREPRDRTEKRLAAAVVRAFPEEFRGKEGCTCAERDSCEECASRAAARVARWEQEAAAP